MRPVKNVSKRKIKLNMGGFYNEKQVAKGDFLSLACVMLLEATLLYFNKRCLFQLKSNCTKERGSEMD